MTRKASVVHLEVHHVDEEGGGEDEHLGGEVDVLEWLVAFDSVVLSEERWVLWCLAVGGALMGELWMCEYCRDVVG